MRMREKLLSAAVVLWLAAASAGGQTGGAAAGGSGPGGRAYALGPDDEIVITVAEAEDFPGKPVRIGPTGSISLPMVGRIEAAGLTVEQLEAELAARLKTYIRNPQVTVTVTEMRSQPVSVIGSVGQPGVRQLQGRKTLMEVLSEAGGLKEDAGHTVKITRRMEYGPIPLPGAVTDASGQFSIAEVSLRELMQAQNPLLNIPIMPNDVITVPRAEMVYVIGDVVKPGGIILGDQSTVTVLQALSMAAGLEKTAKPQDAKILRVAPGSTQRVEVAVNLKDILAGKRSDVPMEKEDILFVPSSKGKTAALRILEAAVGSGTTAIIWRGAR
jgi:polysaccharide export outer membrane protein